MMSKWCIDPEAEVTPDSGSYDESDAAAEPLGPETDNDKRPQSQDPQKPDTLYGAPGAGPDSSGDDLPPPPPPAPRDGPSFEQTESTNTYETGPAQGRTNQGPQAGGPRRNGNGNGQRKKKPQGAGQGNLIFCEVSSKNIQF